MFSIYQWMLACVFQLWFFILLPAGLQLIKSSVKLPSSISVVQYIMMHLFTVLVKFSVILYCHKTRWYLMPAYVAQLALCIEKFNNGITNLLGTVTSDLSYYHINGCKGLRLWYLSQAIWEGLANSFLVVAWHERTFLCVYYNMWWLYCIVYSWVVVNMSDYGNVMCIV